MALLRDAEADGSAVVDVLGAAEPPGGALRGGATQRVPWARRPNTHQVKQRLLLPGCSRFVFGASRPSLKRRLQAGL